MIEQLQGFECPAGEWERLFAERVESYRPEWLDDLCLSGEVVWGRLSVRRARRRRATIPRPASLAARARRRPAGRPSPSCCAQDLPWLLQAHRGAAVPAEPDRRLRAGGARRPARAAAPCSIPTSRPSPSRLPTEVEEGLWDGVARGLITADGFNAVRSLLHARTRFARRQRPDRRPGSRGRRGTWRQGVEGRWTLLPAAEPIDDIEELAETVAWQLLLRWGVVFRDVYLKERLAVPWREILWALRRLEARGLIRGGHFVTGVTGEQFADETTLPLLRPRRQRERSRA